MIGRVDRQVAGLGLPTDATPPQPARDARLLQAASQLEGVFVQQLYKAMRESVPQEQGIISGGTGEEMFTALMDQHLAAETPRHWERGLTAALYRQLSRHLDAPSVLADPVPAGSLPDPDRQTAL
jgi:flagellar protein FlgJ